jgi:hypothetical protein
MSLNLNTAPPTNLEQANANLRDLERAAGTASQAAQTLIDDLNKRYTDAHGNPIQYQTLAEWKKALEAGGLYKDGQLFRKDHTEFQQFLERVKPALNNLETAQAQVANAREIVAATDAMERLLGSGDMSGAVMLLQTTRASGLDQQLKTQITAMQNRNIQIQTLNSRLATEQGKNPRDEAAITSINSQIQKLNGDSQLQMIEIQDLVNKRNQAYDMLSNLLNKFQKTLDGIVGNMR